MHDREEIARAKRQCVECQEQLENVTRRHTEESAAWELARTEHADTKKALASTNGNTNALQKQLEALGAQNSELTRRAREACAAAKDAKQEYTTVHAELQRRRHADEKVANTQRAWRQSLQRVLAELP